MLRVSRLLKRELALQESEARKARSMTPKKSWRKELAGQVQLPPRNVPRTGRPSQRSRWWPLPSSAP